MNSLNDISSIYLEEVFKPQLGKGGDSSPAASDGKKVEKGKDDAESSAKRIRQAVYDIRYRARREDVKLDQAFSQYMGHTTMNAPEKAAVKEKLGLTSGSSAAPVKEELESKKYKVRVKDKESGKSYVRYATREKINQLRSNPNISSVEMTGYGDPYEGEKKKGKQTANVTSGKGLDPVGREDKDIDNDGDHDKSDKYLLNRRKVRSSEIEKKNVKEGFSNWREDLIEVIDTTKPKQIKEKKVKNTIKINPELKESVESLGGFLVDVEELNCVLEKISDEELYFLSDDLIEEVVEEVFYDFLEEGYDVDLIENILCESLDISYELINEKVDMTSRIEARKKYAAASEKSAKEARKSGADVIKREKRAEKIQKVKDTVTKVGSSIKSGIKKAAKAAVHGASYAAGKAVSTAKKVGAAAKSGYDSGKDKSEPRKPKTYRYVKDEPKKSSLTSKVGSLLKKGLKKAVGKTARVVAKGANKVASKLGEENDPCWKGYTMVGMKKKGGKEVPNCVPAKGVKKAKGFKEESELEEKALSRAQQRFMGMVYAAKKGETPASPEVAKAAAGISKKSARDFAKTKHTKLPEKKVEEAVTQVSGRETTPPSGTTAKQDDIQRKQMLANKQKMIQKQQMLQRQQLQLQKQGKLPMGHAEEVEYEIEEEKHSFPFKKVEAKMKEKFAKSVWAKKGNPAVPNTTDAEKKATTQHSKMSRTYEKEKRAKQNADKERRSPTFYKDTHPASAPKMKKARTNEEIEHLDELNRAEKETGINTKTGRPTQKGGSKDDKAFTSVKRMMRGMEGKPAGQRKKVPGKKPPTAGQYGAPKSPAQKVASRRAAAQKAIDLMRSARD
jgi:hypothetical protein